MTDPEQRRDEVDDVSGDHGGETSREVPGREQAGSDQTQGPVPPVSQYSADPESLTLPPQADLETEESDAVEPDAPVTPDPRVYHPEQGRWQKARFARTGRPHRQVGTDGTDGVGAVVPEMTGVSGQAVPALVQGPLPAGSQADTAGSPVAVGYVTPMRGSGALHWLAWGLRIYVIVVALLILFTGVSMINAEGVDGWVPLGSLILGTGMLLPMFYYGVVRERDRQQFVRRLTEAHDVTVDLREKDTQALVYSASLPATPQRTKRNWVVWGTVSAVIIITGLFLLVQGLETSAFTYYPGGFAEPDSSSTSVSAI